LEEKMSDYVSDPDLLARLNTDEYVADPTLLEKLNAPEAKAEPTVVDALGNMTQQVADTTAARAALTAGPVVPGAIASELGSMARLVPQIGWEGAKTLGKEMLTSPLKTGKDLAMSYAQGHALYGPIAEAVAGKTIPQVAGMAGRGALGLAGAAIAAPENAFALPYNMAAYEQEKIRANPTAPQYKTTPYAQAYRGEFPTQGAAAASNRREAIRGQQYGGLSADDQQMLKQDRELSYAMRLQAAKKVLGQQ